MKRRVLTAVVVLGILIPLLFIKNQIPLELLGAVFVLVATFEYIRLAKVSKIYYGTNLLAYGSFIYFVYPNFDTTYLLILKVVIGLFVLFAVITVLRDKKLNVFFTPIVNTLYIGVGIANLIIINQTGVTLLMYLLIVITMTDTFALLIGVKYGKHRLAPTISPKKSIEGAVAGAVFGTLFGVGFCYIFNIEFPMLFAKNLWFVAFMSLSISSIGQIGDLFASKIKRFYNVKDFGTLFPGHGGVLDRFDSLLLSGLILMLLIY